MPDPHTVALIVIADGVVRIPPRPDARYTLAPSPFASGEAHAIEVARECLRHGKAWGFGALHAMPFSDQIGHISQSAHQQLAFSRNLSHALFNAPLAPLALGNVVLSAAALAALAARHDSRSLTLGEVVLALLRDLEPHFAAQVGAVVPGTRQPRVEAELSAGARRLPAAFDTYLHAALAPLTSAADRFGNPLAPRLSLYGPGFIKRMLRAGNGRHLSGERLEALTALAQTVPQPAANATKSPLRTDGFDLIGFARTESGLGENVRALARTCEAAGIPVSVSDVDIDTGTRKEDDDVVHLLVDEPKFAFSIICTNPDVLAEAIHHDGVGASRGIRRIGYWAWELDELPPAWRRAAPLLDEIWTPSEFVTNAVRRSTQALAYTVPTPIRAPRSTLPPQRAAFGLGLDQHVFLFSFAYGSFATRKNPWAVIRAFRAAFANGDEPVQLVIKTTQANAFTDMARDLHALAAGDARIVFIERFLSRAEVSALQLCSDTFVSLHRSEGFGVGMAEMMAAGKSVIGIAWSGNLDFTTGDNSVLVPYRLIPLTANDYVWHSGQVWADASVEAAADAMRRLAFDRAFGVRRGDRAALDMAHRYGEAAIAEKLREHLARLAATVRAGAAPT